MLGLAVARSDGQSDRVSAPQTLPAEKYGLLSKVGLGTFVDPANGGGKLNERTTEELVRLLEIDGEQWLFYKAFPINVAIIRGTTADHNGNISMEKEALTLDNLALATAAKNCKGFVIAQVERIAASGSLNPRHVKIPSVLIDCVVVAQPENHVQTYATGYNGAFSGELRAPSDRNVPMPLDKTMPQVDVICTATANRAAETSRRLSGR